MYTINKSSDGNTITIWYKYYWRLRMASIFTDEELRLMNKASKIRENVIDELGGNIRKLSSNDMENLLRALDSVDMKIARTKALELRHKEGDDMAKNREMVLSLLTNMPKSNIAPLTDASGIDKVASSAGITINSTEAIPVDVNAPELDVDDYIN